MPGVYKKQIMNTKHDFIAAHLKMSEKTSVVFPVSVIPRLQAVTMRFSNNKLPSNRKAGKKFLVVLSELESTRNPCVKAKFILYQIVRQGD